MKREKLPNHDEWLAAEYSLGVLSNEKRQIADERYGRDIAFRAAVDGWHNHLEPLLDEVDSVTPPASVWQAVEAEIGVSSQVAYAEAKSAGIWKWLTGASSMLAAASVAALLYVTGGDVTGNAITSTQEKLAQSTRQVGELTEQLNEAQKLAAATSGQLEAARQEMAGVTAERENSLQRIAQLEDELLQSEAQANQVSQRLAKIQQDVDASIPLVASLTQDGNAPAFVAQYDPLKHSLFIRTSAKDEDEKVPEIWFIPETGAKKGEVLSLGVMNEAAPDRIAIEDEFIPWMSEGGTLAITMEQAGGSPTGVATGPIIAVGKLQALQ